MEGEQFGAKLRYAPFPRQKFLDVAKAKEAGGAWATDYVIAIKGKIEKPRTSKRYGIVRVRSFDMGSADSRQDDQVKTLARAWNMVVCGRFHARNTADETRQ